MNNRVYSYKKIYGIPDRDYFFDSWPVIIIALMWFPPIGLILLFRKKSLHRRNLFKSGNMSIGIGIFFLIIGWLFLTVLPDLSADATTLDVAIGLIFFNLIVGVISLIFGILTKLTAKRYRKYISLVVNRQTEDLNVIAQEMNLSRSKVINDLDKLISQRYLERYVINERENKIYLPEDLIARQRQEEIIKERQEKLHRVVTCKNCGANNLVKEKIGKCEYCNSYIE